MNENPDHKSHQSFTFLPCIKLICNEIYDIYLFAVNAMLPTIK